MHARRDIIDIVAKNDTRLAARAAWPPAHAHEVPKACGLLHAVARASEALSSEAPGQWAVEHNTQFGTVVDMGNSRHQVLMMMQGLKPCVKQS